MVKRLCTLVFLVFSAFAAQAQLPPGVNLKFYTGFDNANPYDSMTSAGAVGWVVDSLTSTPSGGKAMRTQPNGIVGTALTLTSGPISTLNQFKVWLDFNHIAKVPSDDTANVQVSVDGGVTWLDVSKTTCNYLGAASSYRTRPNGFWEFSYGAVWGGVSATLPDSSWWRHERFDLSYIAANRADVRIRFRFVDQGQPGLGVPGRYGWLVDSVMVTSAFSELVPPLITQLPADRITGVVFPINNRISAIVRDRPGCDSTGINSVWAYFRVNSGGLDSTLLNRIGSAVTDSVWRDSIGRGKVVDGDTVRYFLKAIDSSPNRNVTYFPNQTNPGDSVLTYIASAHPQLAHASPWVGQQPSIRPYPITAIANDASGIDSVILHFKRGANSAWITRRMPLIGGTTYRDSIPVIDGDTISYYLEAVDLSARRFRTRIPDTSWTFIASGPPVVTYPTQFAQCQVFQGVIYDLGPFTIGAQLVDSSNIDTAIMHYRVNNGPMLAVGMNRATGTGFCNYQAILPAVSDSDTVHYYIEAIDSSIRANQSRAPLVGFRSFVALAGIVPNYIDNLDGSFSLWEPSVGTGSAPGGWVRGTPAKSTVNAARSGTNAWVTGPLNTDYPGNAVWFLESPVFDFRTVQDATMTFWMWRDIASAGVNGDALWIEYTTNIYAPVWTKLTSAQGIVDNWYNKTTAFAGIPGGFWDGTTPGYQKCEIRLTNAIFQNQTNRIRFRFVFRSTAIVHGNGVAIDDFSITRPVPVDINVLRVVNSANTNLLFAGTQVISNTPFRFSTVVRNVGTAPLDTLPMVWELNGLKDTTIHVFSPPLAVNASQTIGLDSVRGGTIDCWSDIKVFAILPNDGNRLNDTTITNVYGIPTVRFPYLDNFDSTRACNWLPLAVGTNAQPWERGTPAKANMTGAFSGTNAWATGLTSQHQASAQGYLLSPLFDLSRNVNGLLSIRLNRQFSPSGSAMRISWAEENTVASLNPTYSTLGVLPPDPNPNTVNWYNAANSAIISVTGPAFTGVNQPNTYTEHIIELPASFNRRTSRVRFRIDFAGGSQAGNGVAIDNFHLQNPPAVDANLLSISAPSACPDSLTAIDTIQVFVKNSGTDTLRGIRFDYRFVQVGGPTVHAGTIYNAPDTINPTEFKVINFPSFPSPPAPFGDYTLQVYAVQPTDGRSRNDTLTRCVKTIPPTDILLTRVLEPVSSNKCFASGLVSVRIVVRNIGHSTLNNYTISYRSDTFPIVTEPVSRPLAPRAFDTLTFNTRLPVPVGPNVLRVWVNDVNDNRKNNDSIKVDLEGLDPYSLPYFENFETFGAQAPCPYCNQIQINAANSPIGLINIINNVNSSNNPSDKVILMGTVASSTLAWTAPADPWVPTFQPLFTTTMSLPVITDNRQNIKVRFKLLQIAGTGNNFSYLRVLANGVEVARFQPNAPTPASNPFTTHDLSLRNFYNPGGPLIIEFQSKCRYRFTETGNNRNGNLIDDLTVYDSLSSSVEVLEVVYTPPFPTATTPVTVQARIRNLGQSALNSVNLSAAVNGAPLQSQIFLPGLTFLQDTLLNFSTTFNPFVGANPTCVIASQPNGNVDAFPFDDTACTDIIGFDVVSNYPYCNDFDNNQPAWLTLEPFTLRSSGTQWQFGNPQKGYINGPASGANAWYISSDSLYGPRENSALYTPIFTLESDSCYQVQFKSKWLTDFDLNDTSRAPLSGDGGTFEYSTNGGATWDFLGGIDSVSWYTSYVMSLQVQNSNPFLPGLGWSGKSPNNYVDLSHPFASATAQQVLFRFRFATDNDFAGEGWSVDDFCFVKVAGPCLPISVEETFKNGFDVRQNYPNPFEYLTNIEYKIPMNGKVQISVRDMVGRVVKTVDAGMLPEGEHRTELSLENLNAGIYFYTVSFAGQHITKKMIISK